MQFHSRKGFQPPTFRNNNQQRQQEQNRSIGEENSNKRSRPHVECWICKENHYAKLCPLKGNIIHNIQGASTVSDVGEIIPRIYVALDGRQVNRQYRMIEIVCNIGCTYNYFDLK